MWWLLSSLASVVVLGAATKRQLESPLEADELDELDDDQDDDGARFASPGDGVPSGSSGASSPSSAPDGFDCCNCGGK